MQSLIPRHELRVLGTRGCVDDPIGGISDKAQLTRIDGDGGRERQRGDAISRKRVVHPHTNRAIQLDALPLDKADELEDADRADADTVGSVDRTRGRARQSAWLRLPP